MNQVEYIEQMSTLEQESRELKRSNEVQLQLIESLHQDNVAAEKERYEIEKRKQKTEFITKREDIIRRTTELKKARAITRIEEEKALLQQ